MHEVTAPINPVPGDDPSRLAHSPSVITVFEQILAAVHSGDLLPGQRINDAALAEQLGVSRTPVREALLRLREIGIVEASASRYTRIADVTPLQTKQAFVVWLPLYRALLDEVIPAGVSDVATLMQSDHDEFLAALASLQPQRMATANFWFFQRLVDRSANPALQRAITSVVHVVRLGGVHLPHYIDMDHLARAQNLLVGAIRASDLAAAHSAIDELGDLEIPQI